MSHAREITLTFFVWYLSPLMSKVYLLVNLFSQSYMSHLFFSGLLSYLVGMKSNRRHVASKRQLSLPQER